MTAPRPRRWFQIHLSTAIVLMFAAGILLWLNFLPPKVLATRAGPGSQVYVQVAGQGWPFYWKGECAGADSVDAVLKDRQALLGPGYAASDNLVAGLLILTAVAAALEFLTRRREARKP